MPLKIRIIPMLLVSGPSLVKGSQFDNWRRVGTLAPALNVHNARDVDELIIIDAQASRSESSFNINILKQTIGKCFVPLTVGGGITTLDQASAVIEGGADKIVIGSGTTENPKLIEQVATRFGSQAIIAAIDVRKDEHQNSWTCWTHGGTRKLVFSMEQRVRSAESAGAGEILINSIDRDGTLEGYDIPLVQTICQTAKVPVISAGGAGRPEHFVELFQNTVVAAASAGSIFQFTEITPDTIRKELGQRGHLVRNTLRF